MHRIIIIAAFIAISCNCPGKAPEIEAPPAKKMPKEEREIKPPPPVPEPKTKMIAINEIAFERDNAIWLKDFESKQEKKLVDGHLITWLPDGNRLLYYQTYENNVVHILILDLTNLESRSIFTSHIVTDEYKAELTAFVASEKKRYKGGTCYPLGFDSQKLGFGIYTPKKEYCDSPEPIFKGMLKNNYYLTHDWHGSSLSFSADAKKMAMDIWENDSKTWNIYLFDLETLEYQKVAQGAKPELSPTGTKLAFYKAPKGKWFHLASADGSNERKITKGFYTTWLSESKLLYHINQQVPDKPVRVASNYYFGYGLYHVPNYKTYRGRIKILDIPSGNHELLEGFCSFPPDSTFHRTFNPTAISPDNSTVAMIGANCEKTWHYYVGLYNINNKNFSRVKKTGWVYPPIHQSSWSPDGTMLTARHLMKCQINIIDAGTMKVIMQLDKVNAHNGWSWSPDNKYLAYEKDKKTHYADINQRYIHQPLAEGRHPLWCPATEREIQVQ